MNIGIIVLSLNRTAKSGFYHSQELGLGRALAAQGHTVTVYRPADRRQRRLPQTTVMSNLLTYTELPAFSVGINGFFPKKHLDRSLQVLVCFCDTQLYTASVMKWCKKNNVAFYPYIGILRSTSTHALYRRIMDFFTRRLIRRYRALPVVWGKTPAVCAELTSFGITGTKLVPVGLDAALLHQDYRTADRTTLRQEYGYSDTDRLVLFVGRLVPEKEPLHMLRLFAKARQQNNALRLCMIGRGQLEDETALLTAQLHLENAVQLLPIVPNDQMWKFYRMSDCFVNLNRHEIYGMAILEAMYYECPVIIHSAPGPDYILSGSGYDGVCITDKKEEIIRTMISSPNTSRDMLRDLHRHITENFMWNRLPF